MSANEFSFALGLFARPHSRYSTNGVVLFSLIDDFIRHRPEQTRSPNSAIRAIAFDESGKKEGHLQRTQAILAILTI